MTTQFSNMTVYGCNVVSYQKSLTVNREFARGSNDRAFTVSCFEKGSAFSSCEELNDETNLSKNVTKCINGDMGYAGVVWEGKITFYTPGTSGPIGSKTYQVLCTQESLLHLAEKHDPRKDPSNWARCTLRLLKGLNVKETAGDDPPYLRREYHYAPGKTALLFYNPDTGLIRSMYTTGAQNDFGGCANGE
jgi:hypothetical protein